MPYNLLPILLLLSLYFPLVILCCARPREQQRETFATNGVQRYQRTEHRVYASEEHQHQHNDHETDNEINNEENDENHHDDEKQSVNHSKNKNSNSAKLTKLEQSIPNQPVAKSSTARTPLQQSPPLPRRQSVLTAPVTVAAESKLSKSKSVDNKCNQPFVIKTQQQASYKAGLEYAFNFVIKHPLASAILSPKRIDSCSKKVTCGLEQCGSQETIGERAVRAACYALCRRKGCAGTTLSCQATGTRKFRCDCGKACASVDFTLNNEGLFALLPSWNAYCP